MEKIEMVSVVKNRESIHELLNVFRDSMYSLKSGEVSIDTLTDKFLENAIVIKLEKNSKILGFASIYANDDVSKTGYISMIAVIEKARGKGLGSLLLHEIEEICKNVGMDYIKLEVRHNNQNAIDFYKKHGFIKVEDCSDNSFYMEKDLRGEK